MDGIGSRTGRQSSRYGSAPVFTGPVRRWQKQWVNVSSSSVTYNNHSSNRSNSTNNNSNISSVRIRRWTPAPADGEERPRRKLRYAPIVVLESKKKEAEKFDVDVKEASQSAAQGASENDDNEKKISQKGLAAKPQASQNSAAATKDLNNRPIDLDIGDDDGDDDEDHDLGGVDKDKAADWVKEFAC
ncbi:hypothetical protein Hdeb2414_s0001g00016781 [Helianthus debilis subsp. tardiflorus]